MTLLRRPMPPGDERHRPFGAGHPMWMLAAQFAIVLFVFADFDTLPVPLNPKPHFLLSMMVFASIVLLAPRGLMRRVFVSTPVVLFLGWWILSYTWSPIPGTWLNISMTQLSAILVLTVVASVLPIDRFVSTWLGAVYAMVIYTFLYTAARPGEATILYNAGTGELVNVGWHGAFNHKNNMASFMVFGMMLVLSFEKRPAVRRIAVLSMMFLVVMSRSGTGNSAMFASLLTLFWCRRLARESSRKASATIVVSFFSTIIATALVINFMPMIVKLYGKDLTFSGRTEIWQAALSAIRAKPWTGYSWGGVWIDPTKEPTFTIVRKLGFIVFHAHNGAIEILLELGVIGLVLYLTLFFSTARKGWRLMRSNGSPFGQVVVTFCVLVFTSSISEVLVLGPWLSLLIMLHVLLIRIARTGPGDDIAVPRGIERTAMTAAGFR